MIPSFQPAWQPPPRVRALVTTREGGFSRAPYGSADGRAGGLNLGDHCGDDPLDVAANRRQLATMLPSEPHWLRQVHGTTVVDLAGAPGADPPSADAAITAEPGVVAAVLTADCLPVLFADADARVVGIAHAGWRGLAAGVLESTLAAMRARCPDARIECWLGPAIGSAAFEVGDDVRDVFIAGHPAAALAFAPGARSGKWLADLYRLARMRLEAAGVVHIGGGGECTVADAGRFYSYRRDGRTGRFASLIWIDPLLRG